MAAGAGAARSRRTRPCKAGLRHIEFLDTEIEQVERLICQEALKSRQVRRLLTVPGVNVICAAIFLAAVGDIRRFKGSRPVVAYLGLDPRVYQSGSGPARGGRISKQGSPQARWALVEAARSVAQQPGPHARLLRAHQSPQRPQRRGRRGRAQARRAVLLHAHPRGGLRPPAALADRPEAPATRGQAPAPPPCKGKPTGVWATRERMRHAEKQLAAQAEASYKRSVADWKAASPKKTRRRARA